MIHGEVADGFGGVREAFARCFDELGERADTSSTASRALRNRTIGAVRSSLDGPGKGDA